MGRYVNSGRYAYFFLVKVRIGMVIWVGTFIRNFRVGTYEQDLLCFNEEKDKGPGEFLRPRPHLQKIKRRN